MYAFAMRFRTFGLLLLLATSLHAQTLVLAGGRLIDGYGGPPIENAVVVIEGNTIRAAGPESAVKIPAGARVIDTNGYTMMPGLMDMHVHLMILGHGDYNHWFETYASQYRDVIMPISAKELLMAGVSPARVCSSLARSCRKPLRRWKRNSAGLSTESMTPGRKWTSSPMPARTSSR